MKNDTEDITENHVFVENHITEYDDNKSFLCCRYCDKAMCCRDIKFVDAGDNPNGLCFGGSKDFAHFEPSRDLRFSGRSVLSDDVSDV